jgi:putative ABC transport system permease protein
MNLIVMAFRNLILARRRSFLLGIAIALVAALFLFLRVASATLSEQMIRSATTLSTGHVNVGGFLKLRRKGSNPIILGREKLRQELKKFVPHAVKIIDRHRGWGRLIGPQSSFNSGIFGIEFDQEGDFFANLKLAPEKDYMEGGRDQIFGDFTRLKSPSTVLLFVAQAKKLGVTVGDTITVVTEASGGQSNTIDLTVVAVAEDLGLMSNFNIYTARETVLDLYRLSPDTTGALMIYLKNPDDSFKTMEQLQSDLEKKGDYRVMAYDPKPFFMKFDKVAGEDWLGQKLDLSLWSDEISYVIWITRALDLVSFVVIGVLALIIAGGVANAMWMSVRERTKEIGTMRAIGAPRSMIVRLFLLESVMLGMLASTAGMILTLVLLKVVNHLDIALTAPSARFFLMTNKLVFHVHLYQCVSTVLVFGTISGIGALYPTWRAARLKPVEALMHGK